MEQELVSKIKNLEDLVSKTQNDLESANLAKESCEKQIKDLKNTCDRLSADLNTNLCKQTSNLSQELEMQRMKSLEFEQEISNLRKTTERRDQEIAEYIKKLDGLSEKNRLLSEESEKLRSGLNNAYATLEEKLDQTLGLGNKFEETKFNDTLETSNCSFILEDASINHSSYYKLLSKLDSCCKQLEEFERERLQLNTEIDTFKKENKKLEG